MDSISRAEPFKVLTSQPQYFILALALVLFTINSLGAYFYVEEDSFIYFRTAENLAQGHGYVFNIAGERVESGSGFLWQMILAVVAKTGLHLLVTAKFIGYLCGVSLLIAIYRICIKSDVGEGLSALAALLISSNISLIWWSASGMETTINALLIVLCIDALLSDKKWKMVFLYCCLMGGLKAFF